MAALAQRLAALEARLQTAEDRLAIMQLIATYGPAVDGMQPDAVRDLWLEDGVYDTQSSRLTGNSEVAQILDTALHRDYVDRGCAHVMSMPHIIIDGDDAVATGYSNVFTKDGVFWRVERTNSNRWEFVRTAQGWKCSHRLNRLLDGTKANREILARGVRDGRVLHPDAIARNRK